MVNRLTGWKNDHERYFETVDLYTSSNPFSTATILDEMNSNAPRINTSSADWA